MIMVPGWIVGVLATLAVELGILIIYTYFRRK